MDVHQLPFSATVGDLLKSGLNNKFCLRGFHCFPLDDMHMFREFPCFYFGFRASIQGILLFSVWTMYIHSRNIIVFDLDNVHPFKESYCL